MNTEWEKDIVCKLPSCISARINSWEVKLKHNFTFYTIRDLGDHSRSYMTFHNNPFANEEHLKLMSISHTNEFPWQLGHPLKRFIFVRSSDRASQHNVD